MSTLIQSGTIKEDNSHKFSLEIGNWKKLHKGRKSVLRLRGTNRIVLGNIFWTESWCCAVVFSSNTIDEEMNFQEPEPEPDLPDFMKKIDRKVVDVYTVYKETWLNEAMPARDKLEIYDVMATHLPFKIRKEYRKWRFPLDKQTVPNVAQNESRKLQKIVELIFWAENSLEEFGMAIWQLKESFSERNAVLAWLESECLITEFPPFLDTMKNRSMIAHCQQLAAETEQPLTRFQFTLFISNSILGRVFARLLSSFNSFGVNGKPLSLDGASFVAGSFFHRFQIPIPSPLFLLEHCKPLANEFTKAFDVGDIYIGISANTHLSICIPVLEKQNAMIDANYVKVGQIYPLPFQLFEKKHAMLLRLQILKVTF